jgi:hypothetical protein
VKDKPHTDAGAAKHGELKPEWIRPKDVPRYFGLGRTATYALLSEGKLRSVSMRKRGQRHGTRLISYDSLKNYLESLAEGGEA